MWTKMLKYYPSTYSSSSSSLSRRNNRKKYNEKYVDFWLKPIHSFCRGCCCCFPIFVSNGWFTFTPVYFFARKQIRKFAKKGEIEWENRWHFFGPFCCCFLRLCNRHRIGWKSTRKNGTLATTCKTSSGTTQQFGRRKMPRNIDINPV